MQAVVLAAGEGTRMRPLTDATPKPMLPVADRPLVAHAMDAAVEGGVSELIVVVGYEAGAVREYVGDTYRDVPVRVVEQERRRGTADAVRAARDHLEGAFVVLNGDTLYESGALDPLFEAGPAMAVTRVEDPGSYGVVSTSGDRVTDVVEKPDEPRSDRVNAGAYAFPPEAVEWLDVHESERGEYELTDVVAETIASGSLRAVEVDRWLDVGRPWELLAANEWKLSDLAPRIAGDVSDDATLRGTVVVEPGASVEPGVVIEGPALVRAGVTLGPNAYVRGATLLEEGVHVGHGSEVKNTVVGPESAIPHQSYVGDSVLGRAVNFGAGTQVANLRHDGATVAVTVKGERVSTGRRKFGVVCGDGVSTGVNTSITPGVRLSSGAETDAGETVDRDR